MEEEIRERIISILKAKNMSVNSLALNTGYPQSNLNKQIKGSTSMSVKTLLVILDYFKDVSAEWLMHGVGDMIKASSQDVIDNTEIIDLKEEVIRLRAENNILKKILKVKDDDNVNNVKNAG